MSDTDRPSTPLPRTVLLTGVTGFVGQALLERLLREGATVHAVIRSRPGRSAADRLDQVLTKDAFGPWRAQVGDAGVAAARARLHVVDADLADGLPALPADLDLVVHSASCVSFDAPWDEAIRANVLGPARLYEALLASGADPHVVHVSTSYVNTDRTEVGTERSVAHDTDWRAETDTALDLRRRADAASTAPAGVDAAMREAGRVRAHELGWTDVYTMTKSLGERVAEELWAGTGHRLTVLRPTIIESALHHPYPGWIDGFKVADPLIAAYAKGRLVTFPGRPDAVLDVVPVDAVVDTALAAAALPPAACHPRYLQVGTGVSNPITLEEVRDHVESYLRAHPWTDRDGTPIHPEPWAFKTPAGVRAWADRRVRSLAVASRALIMFPRDAATRLRGRIDAATRSLTLLRTYVEIYEPYTCSRTVYDDRHTRALLATARAQGHDVLDVTGIDWRHYLRDVHMPSLSRTAEAHRQAKATPAPTDPSPSRPTPAATDRAPARRARRRGVTRATRAARA